MEKRVHIDFRTVPLKRFFWGRLLRYLCAVAANNYSLINNHVLAEMFIKAINRDHKVLPVGLDIGKFGLGPGQEEYDRRASLITKYRIEQCFTFIYVGTIHKTRQIEDIILAFDKLTKLNGKVQLLVVGGGPHFDSIGRLVKSIDNSKIKLTGIVNHREALSLIRLSNIGLTYYNIDIYNSQPALKTLEYLALGLPVICVDTLGNKEVVTNEVNGILVKDNIDSLYNAMCATTEDVQLYQTMKRNVLMTDYSHLSYDHICEKYLNAIIEAL